ncbi:toll-like receptor 2 [Amphiura filiformis]|uniref:toll-like receptor 2 n=1 Tax=Amphiura filiformis TaxID=82378 RepID=UPI003B224835
MFDIPIQVKSLDISHNPIKSVHFDNMVDTTLGSINIAGFLCGADSTQVYGMSLCPVSSTFENISFSNVYFDYFVWGNCSHLKSLFISESGGIIFKEQDVANSGFPDLVNLTLTKCKLSSIDQFLLESRNLRYLDLSNNNIDNINENDFSSLVNIEYMNLSHNRIYSLPDFSSLVNITRMDLSFNRIESLPETQFQHLSGLAYLNLAGNRLANLNVLKDLSSLQTLIVYDNAMATLPDFLMKAPYNLMYVDFGNNPFSCTCDIKLLQDWLLGDKRTYVDPKPSFLCKSPPSQENRGITETELDCSLHLLRYLLPPGLSGLVIVICLIIAKVYKYRWRIRYKFRLLFYQRRHQRLIDNDDDADSMNSDNEDMEVTYEAPILRRQYHAYVSYHKDNEAWINDQLIPNIEDGPQQFRLCMTERGDIPAGRNNAICQGIYKSRKTIAVLSENFMDDRWCHYQLQIAHMRLELDDDVLILVQIGEIPDDKKDNVALSDIT